MDCLFPAPCAVNCSRFVQLLIDAGKRRNINDRTITDTLPDIGNDIDGTEIGSIAQSVLGSRSSKIGDDSRNNAARFGEIDNYAAHYDHGDEIGHI